MPFRAPRHFLFSSLGSGRPFLDNSQRPSGVEGGRLPCFDIRKSLEWERARELARMSRRESSALKSTARPASHGRLASFGARPHHCFTISTNCSPVAYSFRPHELPCHRHTNSFTIDVSPLGNFPFFWHTALSGCSSHHHSCMSPRSRLYLVVSTRFACSSIYDDTETAFHPPNVPSDHRHCESPDKSGHALLCCRSDQKINTGAMSAKWWFCYWLGIPHSSCKQAPSPRQGPSPHRVSLLKMSGVA